MPRGVTHPRRAAPALWSRGPDLPTVTRPTWNPSISRLRAPRGRAAAGRWRGTTTQRRRRRAHAARNGSAFRELALHYRVLVDVSAARRSRPRVLGQPIALPVAGRADRVPPARAPRRRARDRARRRRRRHDHDAEHAVEHARSRRCVAAATGAGVVPALRLPRSRRDRGAGRARRGRRLQGARAHRRRAAARPPRARRAQPASRCRPGSRSRTCTPTATRSCRARGGDSGLAAYVAELLDPALTLEATSSGCARSRGCRWWSRASCAPTTRVRAVEHGAAGIVVSNHGGRQLDTVAADDRRAAARSRRGRRARAEVLLDGGVRRGTDVVKALALGARAVLVGRPVLWGLAAGGQRGRRAACSAMLRARARPRDGAVRLPDVADITRDLVAG